MLVIFLPYAFYLTPYTLRLMPCSGMDFLSHSLINKIFIMPKYSKGASKKVEKVMREKKRGTLRSGRSGKKVTSRKQAIAIGVSEARKAGAKVPKKKGASKKSATKKSASKRSTSKKSATRRKSASRKKS